MTFLHLGHLDLIMKVTSLQPSAATAATSDNSASTDTNANAPSRQSASQSVGLASDPARYINDVTAHVHHAQPNVNALYVVGEHEVLDLTALTSKAVAKLSGVNVFTSGAHGTDLKVALGDVLSLDDPDLFMSDSKPHQTADTSPAHTGESMNTDLSGMADSFWHEHDAIAAGGVEYTSHDRSGMHADWLMQQDAPLIVHN
jgi:hypothetical protein